MSRMTLPAILADNLFDILKEIKEIIITNRKFINLNDREKSEVRSLEGKVNKLLKSLNGEELTSIILVQQKDIKGLKIKPDEASISVIDNFALERILNDEKQNLLELAKQKSLELLDHAENIDKTESYLLGKILKEKADFIDIIRNRIVSSVITYHIIRNEN